jgi:hypothetical protein
MEEGARFVSPVRQVTPINKHSALDVSTFDSYRGPTPGYTEQVYCLCLWADKNYLTKVMLRNAGSDKAVSMAFSTEELPFFTLWKNAVPYEDGYVTGLEPGTGYSLNRAIERKFGRVPKLAPLQSRSFTIDFSLHDSKEQVDAVAADIAKIQSGRKTQINKKPLIVE